MNLLKHLNDHLTIVLALLSSLGLLIPKVRDAAGFVIGVVTGRRRQQAMQDTFLAELREIKEALVANGSRLVIIEKEMKFNGGKSVKDMLFLMFNYRRHDYWRIGRPALELDGDAQVTLVSEAACRLFGVVNPDDLKRRSWLRFIEAGTVDDLLHAYSDTVAFQSEFTWRMSIRTIHGEERGDWEFRASPITHDAASTKIYSGYLSPANDLAREVAKGIHWTQ